MSNSDLKVQIGVPIKFDHPCDMRAYLKEIWKETKYDYLINNAGELIIFRPKQSSNIT